VGDERENENSAEQSILSEHDPIGRGLEIYIAPSEARQSKCAQRAMNRRFARN
jgi:hypothetical protein